jgi:hypothetical protein
LVVPVRIFEISKFISLFSDVCLLTRDRVMMLLANAYRLPSLDIVAFTRWSGFSAEDAAQ